MELDKQEEEQLLQLYEISVHDDDLIDVYARNRLVHRGFVKRQGQWNTITEDGMWYATDSLITV